MTSRRPHTVFVRDIGPTFTFATADRAHARAAELVAGEYAEVIVTDRDRIVDSPVHLVRTVYRHDQAPRVEHFEKVDDGYAWRPEATS